MPRRWSWCLRVATLVVLGSSVAEGTRSAAAQTSAADEPTPQAETAPAVPGEGAVVRYRGYTLWTLYGTVGALTPEERARLTTARIDQLIRDRGFDPSKVQLVPRDDGIDFVLDGRMLGRVTRLDAAGAGMEPEEAAKAVITRLEQLVRDTREELSAQALVRGVAVFLMSTVAFGAALWLLRLASRHLRRRIWRVPANIARETKGYKVKYASARRVAAALGGLVSVGATIAAILLTLIWLQLALGTIPVTRPLSRRVFELAAEPLRWLEAEFVAFLPNLFFLAVIALVTMGVLRAIRFLFQEVGRGNITFERFPAEWADPTYNIVRVLVIAMAVVAAYPYIPGGQSPAFQGISIFLGLLVSLSSSSAIANIISGVILTYTGAFRLGDVVRIAETRGTVVKKTLLVTSIRTPKNVVVAIPNSLVLSAQVLNYSGLAAQEGLILHTTVTIGYDVPWRKVHELLISAAASAEGILEEPKPFVLQTALNDFSVAYEINAYTREPNGIAKAYSRLHQAIQDRFAEEGVEIMSPHYQAIRDGNQVTLPADHLPDGYRAPAFRVSNGS
jgi:small-conductance mechanosensitive channel